MALDDIAGYSLRRRLGSGSAGTVWLVRDLASGRHAVLKRIPTPSITNPTTFEQDLTTLLAIDHPHIARLIEVRQSAADWLLFGQHVPAGNLTSLLGRRGDLTLGELVTLISPLAEALAILHHKGLPHGRLTPANILFDADGRPVITDTALRSQYPQTTPADDLTALADLTRLAAGTTTSFPDDLFDHTSAPTLARKVLDLAPPTPLNLAFPDHTTSPPPITTAPAPTPTAFAPTPPAAPACARSAFAPTPPAAPTAPAPSVFAPTAFVPTPPASSPIDPGSPTLTPPRPPTPTTPESASPAPTAAYAPVLTRAPSLTPRLRSTTRTRRKPRRDATRRARRDNSTRLNRILTTHRAPRSRRAAYGILAASALAALIVMALALTTLGILDSPTTNPAAASLPSPTRSTPTQSSPPPPATPEARTPSPPTHHTWQQTLEALDQHRAHAFWTLNSTELDAVYQPGSHPWATDRATLATYQAQKIRIANLRFHIQHLTREPTPGPTVTLRVTDRLISATALTSTGHRTTLPPSPPTTRRITLTPTGTTWRITAITPA